MNIHPFIAILNSERALGELEKVGLTKPNDVRKALAITERHRKAYHLLEVVLGEQLFKLEVRLVCGMFDRALFYVDAN